MPKQHFCKILIDEKPCGENNSENFKVGRYSKCKKCTAKMEADRIRTKKEEIKKESEKESKSKSGLYEKTQEQNKELYSKIKPQFRDAAKYIITKYDLFHSPLDYDDNWSMEKIIDFSRVYLENRGNFLSTITFYLK